MTVFVIILLTAIDIWLLCLWVKERKENKNWRDKTVSTEVYLDAKRRLEQRCEEQLEIINDLKKFKDTDALCLENKMLKIRNTEVEAYMNQEARYRHESPVPELFINNDAHQLG